MIFDFRFVVIIPLFPKKFFPQFLLTKNIFHGTKIISSQTTGGGTHVDGDANILRSTLRPGRIARARAHLPLAEVGEQQGGVTYTTNEPHELSIQNRPLDKFCLLIKFIKEPGRFCFLKTDFLNR